MKAVILARVSSREQENGMSIDAQLDNLNKYIQRNGLTLLKTFQITESSTKGDRKKFVEMLNFVKAQREKIAIVADCIDRVQRSFKESVELDELRKADKVELHFIRENLRLHRDSKSNEIAMWDLGVFAAKTYVGNLRDNVKRSIDYNTKHGIWQSQAPLGYLNRRDDNNKPIIVVDPERATGIKRLFEEYASGLYTIGELVKNTVEWGLTNKATGKPITKTAVFNILNNPFYYGMMNVKGALYQHIYQPLIDKTLFDKCQAIMNSKNRTRFKYAEKPYVFRGLIKCADCGCAITSDTKTKPSGKTYTYLSCSHFKGNCTQPAVNENDLLQQIQDEILSKLSFPRDIMQEVVQCLTNISQAENAYALAEIDNLRKKQDALKSKRSRLLDFLLTGSITQEEYADKKNDIEKELYDVGVRLEAHSKADDDFITTVESLLSVASHASDLFKSSKVEQKRALLNLLLSNCELKNKKLVYSIKKPFNILMELNGCQSWLGQLDSNQY